jgi:hypothetical protein
MNHSRKLKNDAVMAGMFNQTKQFLFDNKPVQAMDNLKALEKYIYEEYGEK